MRGLRGPLLRRLEVSPLRIQDSQSTSGGEEVLDRRLLIQFRDRLETCEAHRGVVRGLRTGDRCEKSSDLSQVSGLATSCRSILTLRRVLRTSPHAAGAADSTSPNA